MTGDTKDEGDEKLLDCGKGLDIRIKPKRNIIVEPMMFLYFLSGMPIMDIKSQYMYNRIAADMGYNLNNLSGINSTGSCDVNTSDPGYIAREAVQRENTNLNMYISIADLVPSLVLGLAYGAFSDRMGRRPLFILPCIGSILQTILYMSIIHFNLPVELFILGSLEFVLGGMIAFMGNCFAYIADYVPKEKRALRMVYLDGMIFFNGAVSHLLTGYWIRWQGYFKPLYFVLAGKILTLIYAIFFIPETVPKSTEKINLKMLKNVLGDLKNGFELFTKDNGSNRRWQMVALLTVYIIPRIANSNSISTLFEMNAPLCWDSVFIGYYGVVRDCIPCVGLVLSALVLKRFVSREWQCLLGLTSSLAQHLYWAFVTSTVMMYFVPVLGCLSFLYVPMIRAIMSGLIRLDEQGMLFGVLSCSTTATALISSVMINKIYSATLFFMEGFVFLCSSFFIFIGLLVMMYCTIRVKRNSVLVESEEEKCIQ